MTARSCAELAELRSAYVDGALGDADRERLLTHLVDCADCRRDVAELRHVRALLTGSTDPGLAPVDLSHRLVSIAGDEASEPLWTRPFRRTGSAGQLPSQRHQVRTRVVAGVLGCGLAVLTVLGVGYLSAPSVTELTAVDPTQRAISEFTSVVSAFPLDGRVSVALQGRELSPAYGNTYPTPISLPTKELSEARAARLLTQAGQAGDESTYTAIQSVTLTQDGQRVTNTVRVDSTGGVGTRLTPGGSGSATTRTGTYIESDSSTRMTDADLIDLLRERYRLHGWKSQSYAGRDVYVVEAVEPTASPAPGALDGVAARWWIDVDTHLMLAQETYDGRSNLVVSSKVAALRFGAADDKAGTQDATMAPRARTTTTLTLSRADQLRRDGWVCAQRLAGLPLLRLRTDQSDDPSLVHLVYSNGLTTVSVIEQRGRLSGAPTGTARNETLGAWTTTGVPATATWTSGDVVLTAVTDGPRDTLVAAVAALPHEGLRQPTTMERVRAGWSRILGR